MIRMIRSWKRWEVRIIERSDLVGKIERMVIRIYYKLATCVHFRSDAPHLVAFRYCSPYLQDCIRQDKRDLSARSCESRWCPPKFEV